MGIYFPHFFKSNLFCTKYPRQGYIKIDAKSQLGFRLELKENADENKSDSINGNTLS